MHLAVAAAVEDGQAGEEASAKLALHQLGYAQTAAVFDQEVLDEWLSNPNVTANIQFPDVAGALAHWLANGCQEAPATLSQVLWKNQGPVKIPAPRPGNSTESTLAAIA